jgi:YbbR domain-containing protein
LKLAALGLSIFLWALVQAEPPQQQTLAAVPVRVELTDTAWVVGRGPSPSTVEVRLRGPARDILSLAGEGAGVNVRIGAVGSSDTTVALRRAWVDLGGRTALAVESLSPQGIRLQFEPASTRSVPLALRLEGAVPDGLALATQVELAPARVRVRGPEAVVSLLDSVRIEPFDLGSVTRAGSHLVPVDTIGLIGSVVFPRSARLEIRVEEQLERLLDAVPITIGGGDPDEAPSVVLEPAEVRVRIVGARSVVLATDPANLSVVVDATVVEGMLPGEERTVGLTLTGVPPMATAELETDRVVVRRVEDLPGGDATPERP